MADEDAPDFTAPRQTGIASGVKTESKKRKKLPLAVLRRLKGTSLFYLSMYGEGMSFSPEEIERIEQVLAEKRAKEEAREKSHEEAKKGQSKALKAVLSQLEQVEKAGERLRDITQANSGSLQIAINEVRSTRLHLKESNDAAIESPYTGISFVDVPNPLLNKADVDA